jgi:hypothetical protein
MNINYLKLSVGLLLGLCMLILLFGKSIINVVTFSLFIMFFVAFSLRYAVTKI